MYKFICLLLLFFIVSGCYDTDDTDVTKKKPLGNVIHIDVMNGSWGSCTKFAVKTEKSVAIISASKDIRIGDKLFLVICGDENFNYYYWFRNEEFGDSQYVGHFCEAR